MDRIIVHWTAGAHTPSSLDRQHYHKIIDGAGKVHDGKFPISANEKPVKGQYAAHTLSCNTGSIGVAVAAMAGAQDRPFNAGSHPITPAQVKTLARLCADLARQYRIPITPETILTHAEVQPILGIKQRGKWDITWLPGMNAPGDPIAVGNKLRALIAMEQEERVNETPKPSTRPAPRVNETASNPVDGRKPTDPVTKPRLGIGAAVAALLAALALGLSQAWERIVQFFGG